MAMSARSGQNARPLGSIRQVSPQKNTTGTIPKVSIPSRGTGRADSMQYGIQGSAMTLPSQRPTSHSQDRRRSTPSGSREGSLSVSHEACEREINKLLATEAHQKDQIQQLQKELAELKALLAQKDSTINNLTSKNKAMEKCQQELVQEREKHRATQEELESTRIQLQDTLTQLHTLRQEGTDKMEQLQEQIKELMALKDQEIADRDKALEKLKKDMNDALKAKSLDRQQQLEELGRDLITIKKECDTLRYNLKTLSKNKTSKCENCAQSVARAEKLAVTLKEREVSIKELKGLCTRFETQLSQQDVLLKQWADSKGYKIELPK